MQILHMCSTEQVWADAPTSVTESMPLGNGRLGVNVWADTADTLWLLLSHVDALDENTNLDKLGRVKIEAVLSELGSSGLLLSRSQAFRQEMHLSNATVSVDLTNGVSIDVLSPYNIIMQSTYNYTLSIVDAI